MKLQYLLTRFTKYEGCRGPLRLNDGQEYYLQPPEVTEPCLTEVIEECVRVIQQLVPDVRVDEEGALYRIRTDSKKHLKDRLHGFPNIPQVLDQMRSLGYDIPQRQWYNMRQDVREDMKRAA